MHVCVSECVCVWHHQNGGWQATRSPEGTTNSGFHAEMAQSQSFDERNLWRTRHLECQRLLFLCWRKCQSQCASDQHHLSLATCATAMTDHGV